jgi:hypothetical protein
LPPAVEPPRPAPASFPLGIPEEQPAISRSTLHRILAVCPRLGESITRSGATLGERAMRPSLPLLIVLSLVAACGPFNPPYTRAPRPKGVEQAPRTVHNGHVFYWVGERWYLESGGQWYVYRRPPEPLNQYMWR